MPTTTRTTTTTSFASPGCRRTLEVGVWALAIGLVATLWFFPDALSRLRQHWGAHTMLDCTVQAGVCGATLNDGRTLEVTRSPSSASALEPLTYRVVVEPPSWVPQHIELQGINHNMGLQVLPLAPDGASRRVRSDVRPSRLHRRADALACRRGVRGPHVGLRILEHPTVRRALSVALAMLIAIGAGIALVQRTAPTHHDTLEATYGDFTVYAQDGPVSLAGLDAEVVAVYFGYMSCPDVCPMTLQTLTAAMAQLPPPQRDRVHVLFVSVDPQRDTLPRLAEYAAFFGPSVTGATAPPPELSPILQAWGVHARPVHLDDSALAYTVDHTTSLFIVKPGQQAPQRILAHGASVDDVYDALHSAL